MLRALAVAILLAVPLAATAQTAPDAKAPAARSARGADISRDDYIQHAVERARKSAATRFDRLDANHDGILTADERRAARDAKRGTTAPPQ